MKCIENSSGVAQAVESWAQVFRSTDPFGWPFTRKFASGRVLFPVDGYHLTRDQFSCLARAAAENGEIHCYLAIVEGHDTVGLNNGVKIFLLDFSKYEDYLRLPLTLENALFSVRGSWGALVSHEMHALVSGDFAFLASYNILDRTSDMQWRNFEREWSAEKHREWLTEIALFVRPASDS